MWNHNLKLQENDDYLFMREAPIDRIFQMLDPKSFRLKILYFWFYLTLPGHAETDLIMRPWEITLSGFTGIPLYAESSEKMACAP